jgi:hypothetical protein
MRFTTHPLRPRVIKPRPKAPEGPGAVRACIVVIDQSDVDTPQQEATQSRMYCKHVYKYKNGRARTGYSI